MVISLPLILRFVNREGIDGMYLRRDQLIIGNENISSRSSCICIIHQMVICIALACVKSASSCRPPYSRALGVNIRSDYLSTLIFIRARVGEIIEPYTVLHNSIAQPFLPPPHHLTVPSQSIRSLPPFLLSSHPTLPLDGPLDMTTTSQTWVPTQPGTWRMPKHYGVWATAPSTSNPTMTLPIQKNGPTLTATFMDWFVAMVPTPELAYLRPYIFLQHLASKCMRII